MMESLIVGFVVGSIMGVVAFRIALHFAARKAAADLEILTEALRRVSENYIQARVEEENGVFYVYRVDDNTFIAQGSTLAEIKERVESRIRDARVFVTEGDAEVVARLKATGAETTHA